MRKRRTNRQCPRCGSRDVLLEDTYNNGVSLYICADCDHDFEVGARHRKNSQLWHDRDDERDEASGDYEWENDSKSGLKIV